MSLLETASLHSNPEDAGDSTQLFELRSGKTGGSSPYSSMKARRSRRRKRNPWDLPPSDDEDELDPMNADEDDSYFHDSEMDSDAELLDVDNSDLDRLLEPETPEALARRKAEEKSVLRKQVEYYYGHLTLRSMIFTLLITFVDCAFMIAEIIVGGGIRIAGWANIGTDTLVKMGAKKTALIQGGEVWRLGTAMFLHVGFLHLILNLYSQLIVGIETERGLGFFRLAFVYIISGIGGNLLSAVFMPRIVAVGASGPIFGLFAIYFIDMFINWRIHRQRKLKIIILAVSTLVSMLLGLLPMIDNFAHLGGFICGLLTSLLVIPKLTLPPSNLFQRRMWRTKIILRMIAAALGLIAYFSVTLYLIMSRQDAEQWCKPCEYISCLPIFEDCRLMLGWQPPEAPVSPGWNSSSPIHAPSHL